MNWRKFFLPALCLLPAALAAGRMETKTAVDPNGYHYKYVTNDPCNGREYTLKNGLKVFLSRIPVQPRISFKLVVRAGQADSPPEATGLAHYLEHMLFKGSDKIGTLDYAKEKALLDRIEKLFEDRRKTSDPKQKEKIYAEIDHLSGQAAKFATAGEYSQLIASIGGSGLNAFTASDMTVYVVSIPAQELPKLLQLEAERLRNPVMRLFHTELEAVYEEFNRGMDNDGRLVYEAVNARLFAPHPYSWVPFIGKPEHLKNPSITEITAFLKKYYVPSNMAVLLAGDLDYDRTIQLVDRYFSVLPAAPAPKRQLAKAGPLTADQRVTISSPKSESIRIGFRIEPGRRNELLGTLLADLLSNGSTGLMDSDLVRSQKVLSAGAGLGDLRDYSIFQLSGRPKAGQSLDQLAALLLGELQKVRDGQFSEELLKALILNYRKGLVEARENPESALWTYLDAFVKERDYAENLRIVDDLEKIGKKEIMEFAGTLGHYVRADKVTGKADESGKVPKPKMTPVTVNSDKHSAYGKEFLKLPPAPLPPLDVIDFKKDFSILPMPGPGHNRLFYNRKLSPVHDTLFTLQIFVDAGSDHDPLLPLALGYLEYLGTRKYGAQELRWEYFKDALDFSFSCGAERSSLNLSGFASRMDRALELADDFLRNMKPDEKAWQAYVARILKARADAKKNQQACFRALNNYVAYGPDPQNNPLLFANSIGEKKLKSVTAKQAVELAQQCFRIPRMYVYAGPEKADDLKKILEKHMTLSQGVLDWPGGKRKREFKQLPTEKPRVFLLDYDSAQFLVGIRTRAEKFSPDPAKSARIMLFNQYFGAGGLDDVVFQEIRESRSLAYSSYAVYSNAMEKDRYDIIFGFVGTQPDKFFDAADQMLKLFRNMPLYPGKIEQARTKLLKNLSASKTYGNLAGVWFQSEKTGIKRDLKPEIFAVLQKLTPQQIADFASTELAKRQYDLFVVGPVDKLDRKKLEKYGQIQTVTREQVFGY
ncbi:MAG: insulinase family protein [Lentisphaeria bacterium]|nr:insulinase family protein [Lentisphaeria bacterium]